MQVIRAKQVFNGEHFLGPGDVVLDGPNIVGVNPPMEYAAEVPVEDLGDVTVLPGLVDAHQHLTWDCSFDAVGWHERHDDEALLQRGLVNAQKALSAGVTAVRDLGGRGRAPFDLRDECSRNPKAGPTLLVSGPALTTPGGHCWFLGGQCGGAAELVTAVARLDEAGVDVIKVMATGGNLTPGSAPHESQFRLAELRAVVEAAHAAGLPVAAHAHGTQGVSDALDARVDTIEHCSFMTADGVAEDPALVERLASSGITVSITGGTIPGPIPPAIAVRMPALARHGRRMVEAGVRCIISTDAGIGPAKPHDLLARTVEHAVEDLGATVDEALAMCTARAAEAIGLGHRAGRLRPGAAADLLVVSGRVDHDPSALRDPVRVLHGGITV